MLTPEELQEEFMIRLERYTDLYKHHQDSQKEPCSCAKMVTGLCRRCQRLQGLTLQMAQTQSLPLGQNKSSHKKPL